MPARTESSQAAVRVSVSLNGQDYSSSHVKFQPFNLSEVRVSSLMPSGGPYAGGTLVLVLGAGFADHNAHCRFGAELVRATLVNSSRLLCDAPALPAAAGVALEVTLNGDTSAHTITADGVGFTFFDPSAVTVDSLSPLGGPTDGGTRVEISGSGLAEEGSSR